MTSIKKFISSGGILKVSPVFYVSVFSFFALVFFVMGQGIMYSSIFLSVILLHEFAHIFFLIRYKAQIKQVTIFPFGIDIRADTSRLSYKRELVCILSGSFANLFVCLICIFFFLSVKSPALLFFIVCNFFLGIFNLIPLPFFDGGKAVRLILYDITDIDTAFRFVKIFEIASACIFLVLAGIIVCHSGCNLSVLFIIVYASLACLAENMKKSKK